jgi:hypothetical protein
VPTLHPLRTDAVEEVSLVINSTITRTPFTFSITFRTKRAIYFDNYIVFRLPRFTRNLQPSNRSSTTSLGIAFGDVLLSPSYYFSAEWIEGSLPRDGGTPYANATMMLKLNNPSYYIDSGEYVTVTFFKENGIGAICGHLTSSLYNSTGGMT